MNRKQHRSLTIESVITDPKPRARITAFVDPQSGMVELRMGKGNRHRTVTLSRGAFEYLTDYVHERFRDRAPAAFAKAS